MSIKWNIVKYIDNMDKEEGLPSLPDKSVDLCITDPPWNINYTGLVGSTGKKTGDHIKYEKKHYIDKIENYKQFSIKWFSEIERICERIILAPGRQNLKLWYNISDPKDLFIHYKKNGGYGSYVATFNNFDVYLYYGKSSKPFFSGNVLYEPVNSGWMKKHITSNLIFKHTSPKNTALWYRIVKGIKPKSVIDPFLGSGTTAEVCTKLGIPWLGYEISEIYSQDINKRLRGCKQESQQTTLEVF